MLQFHTYIIHHIVATSKGDDSTTNTLPHTSSPFPTPNPTPTLSSARPSPTEAVDWWALGVLIVHLLTGATPFASLNDDELRIYKRITRAQPALPPGADISPESQDLVRQLLVRDPTKRLGQVRRVAAGGRGVVMGRQLLA